MKRFFVLLLVVFGVSVHYKVHTFNCDQLLKRLYVLLASSDVSISEFQEAEENFHRAEGIFQTAPPSKFLELDWSEFYCLMKNRKTSSRIDEIDEIIALLIIASRLDICDMDQLAKVFSDHFFALK